MTTEPLVTLEWEDSAPEALALSDAKARSADLMRRAIAWSYAVHDAEAAHLIGETDAREAAKDSDLPVGVLLDALEGGTLPGRFEADEQTAYCYPHSRERERFAWKWKIDRGDLATWLLVREIEDHDALSS